MKQVAIYTTPICQYCQMAKDFFEENNIEYTEHNVQTDEDKRNEMVEKSGQMGVPVITVDNEVVIGFDKEKLQNLLELQG